MIVLLTTVIIIGIIAAGLIDSYSLTKEHSQEINDILNEEHGEKEITD